jgi:hypothetical protein
VASGATAATVTITTVTVAGRDSAATRVHHENESRWPERSDASQDDGQNTAYQRFAVIQNAVQTARPHVAARRRAVRTATEDVNAKALHTGDNTNDMGVRRQPFAADATERA